MSAEDEGSFTFTVSGFSQLDGNRSSEKHTVNGLVWQLMVVYKELSSSSQPGKSRPLGIYLRWVPQEDNPSVESVSVKATITILSKANPPKHFSKEFSHKYTSSQVDWGFSSFIKAKEFYNPARAFIDNDSITLVVRITTLQPHSQNESSATDQSITQDYSFSNSQSGVSESRVKGGSCASVLECPSCHEDYHTKGSRKPMSLRCGHTFCLSCLESTCNSKPDSASIVCSVRHLQHQGQDLLSLCVPNHTVIQLIGNIIPKSKYFCQQHKQNMDYFCLQDTCNCLVCIVCAYHGSHSGHLCKPTEEAKAEIEKDIQGKAENVSKKSKSVVKRLELLREEQNLLATHEANLIESIEKSYEKLKEIISRRKESQLQEMKAHMEEFSSSLQSAIGSTEEKMLLLDQAVKSYQSWKRLEVKEALHQVASLKSTLLTTESVSIEPKPLLAHKTTISLTRPFSELFSAIESQGIDSETRETVSTESQSVSMDPEMPPNKRKKLN